MNGPPPSELTRRLWAISAAAHVMAARSEMGGEITADHFDSLVSVVFEARRAFEHQ